MFENSIGVDLREAVRSGDGPDPCERGLRSVCWKAFLLYGPISQASWPKKLSEGRSAYSSLRDHFLRFIDNPNDIQTAADPLADDDTSPWSTLRNDELNREEIFQDVTRCMQENFFFREPKTQKKLLDILFIYSKLNPDTGYRQGMHELLAPLLWVVSQDSLDATAVASMDKRKEGSELMLAVLDRRFVEHDAFNLFCAVMQTAKSFYEVGDNKEASPIVKMSKHIHDDLLATFDPELALHLQVVGVLPQIYAIRWIRLLFGREFDFKEALRVWDILFAESLRTEIIDLTCVTMLLRIRWRLVEADYSTAITSFSRYNPPNKGEDPRILVRDALHLDKNRTAEAGGNLIQQLSGRKPKTQRLGGSAAVRIRAEETPLPGSRSQHRPSPSASPARYSTPQKQLESLFQQVSGGIQQRAEGWNVSKAVRGAVGEVRRNMNNLQAPHSRTSSVDRVAGSNATPRRSNSFHDPQAKQLNARVLDLEARNKALAKMLDSALDSLRASKGSAATDVRDSDEEFNISLAKIQFVSVYLADPEIPIPPDEPMPRIEAPGTTVSEASDDKAHPGHNNETSKATSASQVASAADAVEDPVKHHGTAANLAPSAIASEDTALARPSLAESSFSFMLGPNQHRSGFVSSVADLPEQRRGSDAKPEAQQLSTEDKGTKERKGKETKERKGSESKDDGFTMNSLRGGRRK